MPIIPCEQCSSKLRLPEGSEGRSVSCPKCGHVFKYNAPAELNAAADEPAARRDRADAWDANRDDDGRRSLSREGDDVAPYSNRSWERDDNRRPSRRRDEEDYDDDARRPRMRYRDSFDRSGTGRQKSSKTAVIAVVSVVGVAAVIGVIYAAANGFLGFGKIPDSEWKSFEEPNRYKVVMPGSPKRSVQQEPGGLPMTAQMVEYDRNTAFIVSHSEGVIPPQRLALPVDVVLNDGCDGAMRAVAKEGAVEQSRESIQLGQVPGKQMIIDLKKNNIRGIARIYLTNNRVYMLVAVGKGYTPENKNVKRFFDSFEIIENAANRPPVGNPKVEVPIEQPPRIGFEPEKKNDVPRQELPRPDPRLPKESPQKTIPQYEEKDPAVVGRKPEMVSGPTRKVSDINVRSIAAGKGRVPACLCWSDDAKAFYTLDGAGTVRRISYPELTEESANAIGRSCSWISLSSQGLLATVPDAQEAWLLDPKTLKETTKIPIGKVQRVVSSPKSALAYGVEENIGNSTLNVFDLKAGKQINQYFGVSGFKQLAVSPDGGYLFAAGGVEAIFRFKLNGKEVAQIDDTEQIIQGRFEGLSISNDGDYICAPSGGGNYGASYSTYIYSTASLKSRILTISSGPYPMAIGFDLKSGLIYAQNFESALIVFDAKGVKRKQFALERGKTDGRGTQIRQFLVHPSGRKLLILADTNIAAKDGVKIFAVELTGDATTPD